MNDIFDVLEICLQELENGAEVETVLARYPHFAAELRPILAASVMARTRGADLPGPSPEAVRRGRARLLQHAAQMREAKVPARKRVIPIFQRLAIASTLAALFLTSGTGLVSASSTALPGENLYPVKLTWENVRLLFTFDEEYRETLEHTFESERLHEVNELIVEGRHETIQFAGVYMEVNGITYVSGIHVVVLDTSTLPLEPLSNGMAVAVTGHTNAEGFVDVESIELLPSGTVVPVGEPVEVETEHGADNGDLNSRSREENKDDGTKDNASVDDHGDDRSTDGDNQNEGDASDSNDDSIDDNTNSDNADDSNDNSDSNDDGGDDDNSGSGGEDSTGGGDGGDDNSGSGGGD
jgi:uncharacterized membrane protein YgcG